MNFEFSGTCALILGGSCDLALCLAGCMIKAGLFPVLTYRSQKGQDRISDRLKACYGSYSTCYLDFSDRDSLGQLLQDDGASPDFLVDFVQGDLECLIASAESDDIYRYFSENVSFRAEVLKKVARMMLAQKRGRLVYISSSAALRPNPGQGFYRAAKLAAEALYRNLGLELGSRGITTITLRPGYVDEGRGREFIRKDHDASIGKVPIKRALTAKEVAETILFYLSDSARGFNATEISLDGGLTAGK
jgi:3-oxoacyl-[acyl-carrier protein] reductase